MKSINVIIGGGEPIENSGFHFDWEKAHKWQDEVNENPINDGIEWSWDCSFKLDYDGSIVRVSSRFYPPSKHYGDGWDGKVDIMVFDKCVKHKKFQCDTLEQLKKEVEAYVKRISESIKITFS